MAKIEWKILLMAPNDNEIDSKSQWKSSISGIYLHVYTKLLLFRGEYIECNVTLVREGMHSATSLGTRRQGLKVPKVVLFCNTWRRFAIFGRILPSKLQKVPQIATPFLLKSHKKCSRNRSENHKICDLSQDLVTLSAQEEKKGEKEEVCLLLAYFKFPAIGLAYLSVLIWMLACYIIWKMKVRKFTEKILYFFIKWQISRIFCNFRIFSCE